MELLIILAAFWAYGLRDNRQEPAAPRPPAKTPPASPTPEQAREARRKGVGVPPLRGPDAQPEYSLKHPFVIGTAPPSDEDQAGELRRFRSAAVANAMRRSCRR
jgi:hypothetical protein